MDEAAVYRWLQKRKRADAWLSVLTSIIALLFGLMLVYLSFWFGYVLTWLGSQAVGAIISLVADRQFELGHRGLLIGGGVFVILLFVGNAKANREDLETMPKGRYGVPPGLTMRAGILGGLLVMLAHPGASSRLLAQIFFSGPRLVNGAWSLASNAVQAGKMHIGWCTTALMVLLEQDHAVSHEALEASGLQQAVAQLRGFDGVVFLEKGVSLTSDLRRELKSLG